MSPEETLNAYLVERFGLALEDVLDAASQARLPAQLGASVTSTAHRLDYWRDEDGAVTELYPDPLVDAQKDATEAIFAPDR